MRILALLFLPWALSAQDRPQFVWQGQVDGIDVIHLKDNRLTVQVQEGEPVEGQIFRFYGRLPEVQQNVRVDTLQGRGAVRIVAQPRLDNQYTLSIAIEDRQPGRSFYSIAVFWDESGRLFDSSEKLDKIAWSGRVDEEAVVECSNNRCVSKPIKGQPVADEHVQFSRPMPHQELNLRLDQAVGRGQIHLAEQPRAKNNYTARVSIRDPQAGSGDYAFTLVWARPKGKESKEPEPVVSGQGLFWTGFVEGRVRVTVQGGATFSEAVGGKPVTGERVDFLRPLPSRSDLNPAVKKLRGRGKVEIVETPSEKNNFRLVFEITDPGNGPDQYEVEVDW